MPSLSTGSAPGDGPRRSRAAVAGRFVGGILPVVAAAALAASLLAGDLGESYVLRAIAPGEVAPNEPFAVRAAVFASGAHDTGAPVDAEIRAHLATRAGGFQAAPVPLRPSAVLGAEGEITPPADAPERVSLFVEAFVDGEPIARASRPIRIHARAARAPARTRPRSDLERLAYGAMTGEGALAIAVPSGSCVPELPCRVVLEGDPAFSIAVEPATGVDVLGVEGREARLVVRGPEGRLTLVARRDGEVVGRRDVRLPLALGGVAVDVERAVVEPGASAEIAVWSLEDGAIAVDLFRDDRWAGATSLRVRANERHVVSFPGLRPGSYRAQAQRHVLTVDSADRAGIARFVVTGGDPDPDVRIDEAPDRPLGPPQAFGGGAESGAALERGRRRARLLAASAALGAGLVGSALLLHGGPTRSRRRIRAEVVGYAFLVLLAFAAVAAFAWMTR